MAYTLKIKNVKEDTLIADNTQFLDVEVEIFDGKKVVEVRKFGYPLETSEKTIKAALEKFISLYNDEAENAVLDKEKQKVKVESQKTITNLNNLEINAPTKKLSTKNGGKK